jgi:hypothetical protein
MTPPVVDNKDGIMPLFGAVGRSVGREQDNDGARPYRRALAFLIGKPALSIRFKVNTASSTRERGFCYISALTRALTHGRAQPFLGLYPAIRIC